MPDAETACRLHRHVHRPNHRHPHEPSGIDWLELLVQLVVAVIGVALVAGAYGRRGVRR